MSEDSGQDEQQHRGVDAVLAAASAIHELADRLGHVPVGEHPPTWLLTQRCPALIGPLVWEAAESVGEGPVLKWFLSQRSCYA